MTSAGKGRPALSVVLPAYQEEDRIATAVARLRRELSVPGQVEIVVVDDGSRDGTAQAARRAGADQVLSLPTNLGKGAAVRTGMLAASGHARAFTDVDLAYPPAQLLRLLAQVEAGWDVVIGSRRHVDTTTLVRARRVREVSGRVFNLLSRVILLHRYLDTQCGLKAFVGDAAEVVFARARVDGFAFDVELLYLAQRYGLTLKEEPVELADTGTSTVRLLRDAPLMVRDLVRIRRWGGAGVYDLAPEEQAVLDGRAWRRAQ